MFHAVRVNAVNHQFPGAAFNRKFRPLQSIAAGILAAAPGKNMQPPLHPFHVHAQYHALIAIALRRRRNQLRVAQRPGVDADLIRAAFQNPVKIVQITNTTAHRQRNKNLSRHTLQNINKQRAPLGAGRNIIKNQLISAGFIIKTRQSHRVVHVLQTLKVQPLNHPAIAHVQTRNYPLGNHCAPPLDACKHSGRLKRPL